MPAGPETDHISHADDSERRPHKSTRSEIVANDSSSLKEDAAKIEKGNVAASEAALREVLNMKNGGYLKDVAQDLEKSGNAKITYGANGEVEHIVFNGTGGKAPVDVDLQHETINGKSATQIRDAEVKQAKEYCAAGLSDPKMTDASGKPLSPEAQAAANALVGALLDGDAAALTKASQEIMKNPDMANSIEYVLKRLQDLPTISFRKDAKGQPYMQAGNGEFDAVIVPASGAAYATSLDYRGNPDNSRHPSLDTTMKSVSDWSLLVATSKIDSAEGYLDMVDRLPDDGYTSMKDLERAYSDPHLREDNAKIEAMIEKELAKMTPEGRAAFEKLRHGGRRVDEDERREHE